MSSRTGTASDRRTAPARRWALPAVPRLGRGRRLPLLRDVDPTVLGVHAPVARYVERDVDARLGAAVGSTGAGAAGVVIACGPRLAGTTYALARAARLLLGDHAVLVARPRDAAALRALLGGVVVPPRDDDPGAGPAPRPVVVWVDDAPLTLLADLTDPARLADLPGLGEDVRVLLTARDALLHPDVVPGPGDGARSGPAPVVAVDVPGPLSPAEAGRGAERGWSAGTLVGRHEVDLGPARDALCPRPGAAGVGEVRVAAVLRAAADWDRLAVGDALSRSTLARLAVDYARELDPHDRPHTVAPLLSAVDALGTRRGSWLRREQRGDRLHHAPDPRVTAVADDLVGTTAGWSAPPALTAALADHLDSPVRRRGVGVLALQRRFDDPALHLLAPTGTSRGTGSAALSAATAYNAGLAALEAGRPDDARHWFAAVAEGTDPGYRPRAAFWLGLDGAAPLDERRRHLTVVVAEGPARDGADAAYMLAALERDAGRPEHRRHWLEVAADRAADADDAPRRADALLELAHLDRSTGAVEDARRGFEEVAATGDPECAPEALTALGALAEDTSDSADSADTPELPQPRSEEPAVRSPVDA